MAIREAAQEKSLKDLAVSGFEAVAGHGIQAELEGNTWYLGNTRMMDQKDLSLDNWQTALSELDSEGQTPVFLADGHTIHALFGVADALKEDAKSCIQALQMQGLDVIMLTGDRQQVAEHIAQRIVDITIL